MSGWVQLGSDARHGWRGVAWLKPVWLEPTGTRNLNGYLGLLLVFGLAENGFLVGWE